MQSEGDCVSRVDLFTQLWTLVCLLVCFSGTVSAQDQAAQRLTVVTANANLRAQPSRQGTILSVAEAGTVVHALSRSGSWERVKIQSGTVGWIHTSLLVQLQKPDLFQTAPAPAPAPAAAPAALPQQQADEQQAAVSGTGQATSHSTPGSEEPLIFPETNASTARLEDLDTNASADEVDPDQNDAAGLFGGSRPLFIYILAALLVSVLGLVVFQIRRTREIKQRIYRLEQTAQKDSQEDSSIQPVEPLEPQSTRPEFQSFRPDSPDSPDNADNPDNAGKHAQAAPQHTASLLPALLDLPVEFSPAERAVLETIFSHKEVPEHELKAMLDKRGFPGMLLKAVVGDIMRKTGSDGIPWIRVHYTQGVFSYQLQHLPKRSHDLAIPNYLNGQEHSNT